MRKIALMLSALLLLGNALPDMAKADNSYYEYVILEDGTAELTKITKAAPNIPHQIEGYTLTSIADGALTDINFQNVVIPDSVTHLGKFILGDSNKVVSVTLPNSIIQMDGPLYGLEENQVWINDRTPNLIVDPNHPYLATIDGVLFSKPDKRLIGYPQNRRHVVTEYDIPDGIKIIGSYAFSRTNIHDLTIPSSVTEIRESAFAFCGTTFVINNANITRINDYCFDGSTRIIGVSIPNTVTSIGQGAFRGCSSLQILSLPTCVTSIGDCAFQNCSSLAELIIPEGATIGEDVFVGCYDLKSINIPNSVQNLDSNPFADCEELSISVAEDHPIYAVIEGVLFSKVDKRLISFPSTATIAYEVPNGIVEIGEKAFAGRKDLKAVRIPTSVTKIADDAFSGCDKLMLIVDVGSYAETYAVQQGLQYNYANRDSDWLND